MNVTWQSAFDFHSHESTYSVSLPQ